MPPMPMRVTCDHCAASYTLPDSRLTPGRRVQFLCRHCQNRIIVDVPEAGASGAETTQKPSVAPRIAQPLAAARPAKLSNNVMWFVVGADGQQQRIAADGVRQSIQQGEITADSLLWRRGMGEWLRAIEIAEWTSLFPAAVASAPVVFAAVEALKPALNRTPSRPLLGESPCNISAEIDVAKVAGASSVVRNLNNMHGDASQVAVAMPVIRFEAEPVEVPVQRAGSGLRRHEPGQRANAQPRPVIANDTSLQDPLIQDSRGDPNSRWSPATDTYTGPRAAFTRRLNEDLRQALLAEVDAKEADMRAGIANDQVQLWRRVATFALVAAAVSVLIALFAVIRWRSVNAELDACSSEHRQSDAATPKK